MQIRYDAASIEAVACESSPEHERTYFAPARFAPMRVELGVPEPFGVIW